MSYELLVKGSNPLGYWHLNGTASAVVGSTLGIFTPVVTQPALVSNSGSGSLLNFPNSTQFRITNTYKAFLTGYESSTLAFEFWLSFNNSFNGSGWQTNLSSSSQYFQSNQINLITILNGSTQVGAVYYDYTKNTLRFKIFNGSIGGNTEAYIPIRNLNTSFYVLAYYQNKSLHISVNGQDGAPGYAIDTSLFPASGADFFVGATGTSAPYFSASSQASFTMNDLAIYNYVPNKDQQRRRVLFATHMEKPISVTSALETSYFDFYENPGHILWYKEYSGSKFDSIFRNNVIVDNAEGLKGEYLKGFVLSSLYPSGSTTITASGVNFSGSVSALQFDQFGHKFGSERFTTITAQVSGVSATPGVIFSIPDSVNGQGSLYVTAASAGFTINTYDPITASAASVLFIASAMSSSSTVYNFGLSLTSQNLYAYGNAVTGSVVISNMDVADNSTMIVGNLLESPSANPMTIQNFGMNNYGQTTFSGYDFTYTQASGAFYGQLVARFNKDYSVSQFGVWQQIIPLSHFGNYISGTNVTWDGMDNCLVQTSDDFGVTWNNVYRGQHIPNVITGYPNQDKMLRVIVPYEYELESQSQSFNNLNIAIYGDQSFLSSDGNYRLSPFSDTTGKSPYTVKRDRAPITFRQGNFGIRFNKISGSVDSYAVIVPTGSATPYGIDFWTRLDSYPNASNYILDGSTGSSGAVPTIYTSSAGVITYTAGTLYVYGASVASGTATATVGELYHLFHDFGGAMQSSASIYINGKYNGSASTHSHATYGHVNVWNSAFTNAPASASARYLNHVGTNIAKIVDSASLLWQPNWASDLITSASGFKIG